MKPADLMSLKDLCTIDILPELIDAGVDSFKIEGRMKQPEYVYTVVKMYRNMQDHYLKLQKEGKTDRHTGCQRLINGNCLLLTRGVVIVRATIISITAEI